MRRPLAPLAALALAACATSPARPPAAPEAARAVAEAEPGRADAPGQAARAAPPVTRALDAYLGRQILVSAPGAQPEPWTLREIAGDHLTLERSRTYRVIPVRRISEITWTDLAGIDPTPRLVLAPQ